jgi:release factor glutamine methyltransferase
VTGPTAPTGLAGRLAVAAERLAVAGVATARVDAELLASHVWGVSLGRLRALVLGGLVDDDGPRLAAFEAAVARRERREPLQHITGLAPFRGLELLVGPGVFIPRPETEITAGLAIEAARVAAAVAPAAGSAILASGPVSPAGLPPVSCPVEADTFDWPHPAGSPHVVDLCTGSGAIAAAVAAEMPGARVTAVEIDPSAYAWAQRNLAETDVQLLLADATDPALAQRCAPADVVVANPPYIPSDALPIDPEVANYDPPLALYGRGPDGLGVVAGIVDVAGRLLKPGGVLVLEHGANQGAALRSLAAAAGFTGGQTARDLAGRERVLRAVWPGTASAMRGRSRRRAPGSADPIDPVLADRGGGIGTA